MVEIGEDGYAEFRFFRPKAANVFLAGDFNEWRCDQLPMVRSEDGYWALKLRLPAGDYQFYNLSQPGVPSVFERTDIQFQVQPGRTIYIGRLVLAFPPERINILKRFKLNVEDARATSISGAESEYGVTLSDVITDLMSVPGRIPWPYPQMD